MTDDRTLTPNQTAEYERALLACALQNADTARELLALVQAPMIADAGLSRAWSALRRVLAAETGPVYLTAAVAGELVGEGGDPPDWSTCTSWPARCRPPRMPPTTPAAWSMPTSGARPPA